jgi:hypothetical protein
VPASRCALPCSVRMVRQARSPLGERNDPVVIGNAEDVAAKSPMSSRSSALLRTRRRDPYRAMREKGRRRVPSQTIKSGGRVPAERAPPDNATRCREHTWPGRRWNVWRIVPTSAPHARAVPCRDLNAGLVGQIKCAICAISSVACAARLPSGHQIACAKKLISPADSNRSPLSSPPRKNISLSFFQKMMIIRSIPPQPEGRTRDRHDTRGGDAVAAVASGAFARDD